MSTSMVASYPFPAFGPERPLVWWKAADIIALLCTKMDVNDWRPITGCAVVIGESGGNPLAIGKPVWAPSSPAHLSLDLGMFQLNSYWQTVIPPVAFNPWSAWEVAWKMLQVGRTGWSYNWSHWIAYTNLSYKRHLTTAYHGMQEYRQIMGLPPL
jgi:hypothetical protein